MTSATTYASEAQEKLLDALREGQEAVVGVAKALSDAVVKAAEQFPAAPWGELPTPVEVVDGAFGFARDLLGAQHAFAKGIAEAWSPVLEAQRPAARKPATTKAS